MFVQWAGVYGTFRVSAGLSGRPTCRKVGPQDLVRWNRDAL